MQKLAAVRISMTAFLLVASSSCLDAAVALNSAPGDASGNVEISAVSEANRSQVANVKAERRGKKWLRGKSAAKGRHDIAVTIADGKRGVIAGYEAPNGERVLIRAAYLSPKVPYAEILYFDEETGNVERLFPIADERRMVGKLRGLPSTKETASMMRKVHKLGVSHPQSKVSIDRLSALANTPVVKAAEDGVVALYLAIDEENADPALAALLRPLGAFAMATQIGAGGPSKRTPRSSLTPPENMSRLASQCERANCVARGQFFAIDQSGFFDVIGQGRGQTQRKNRTSNSIVSQKLGVTPAQQRSLTRLALPPEIGQQLATVEECVAKAAIECFGHCGRGCPVDPDYRVDLPECYAHDFCVCLNDDNHLPCMFSVPDGCVTDQGPCASLGEATAAVLERFFQTFVENTWDTAVLLIDFFEELVGDIFDVIVSALDTFFDLVGDFLDWLFGPNCEEESQEAC